MIYNIYDIILSIVLGIVIVLVIHNIMIMQKTVEVDETH
jgi:hypothetical protein